MADVFDRGTRSRIMRAVRSRGTRPERALEVAVASDRRLRRFRREAHPRLPGRPDMAFGPRKVAVFVDGCFWHGCPEHYRRPKTNRRFWGRKVSGNRERDARVGAALSSAGWSVLRFWEHEVRADARGCAAAILSTLDAKRGASSK